MERDANLGNINDPVRSPREDVNGTNFTLINGVSSVKFQAQRLGNAVQFIQGGFAFRAGREFGFKAPVWDRGFSEVRVNTSQAAERIARYIVENPVRAGLVQIPNRVSVRSGESCVCVG